MIFLSTLFDWSLEFNLDEDKSGIDLDFAENSII